MFVALLPFLTAVRSHARFNDSYIWPDPFLCFSHRPFFCALPTCRASYCFFWLCLQALAYVRMVSVQRHHLQGSKAEIVQVLRGPFRTDDIDTVMAHCLSNADQIKNNMDEFLDTLDLLYPDLQPPVVTPSSPSSQHGAAAVATVAGLLQPGNDPSFPPQLQPPVCPQSSPSGGEAGDADAPPTSRTSTSAAPSPSATGHVAKLVGDADMLIDR